MLRDLRRVILAILDIVLAIITLFLGARIILKLVTANPETPIVAWIYSLTDGLIYPFQNIFPAIQTGTGIFDITAIITMVAYILVFYVIIYIVSLIPYDRSHTVVHEHTKEV